MSRLAPFLAVCLLLGATVPAVAQNAASSRTPLVAGRTEAEWRDDLRNPQGIVRQAALEALVQLSAVNTSTIRDVILLIGDPDVAVRRIAIRAVGRAGNGVRKAQPALWRAWRDDDALVSADAGIALLSLNGNNAREFRTQLSSGDARQRARAAAALANGGVAARIAIHALRDRLNDDDSRVRSATLTALDALDATPGKRTALLVGKSLDRELSDSPQLDALDAVARARTALALLARAKRDARGASHPLQLLLWDGPAPLRNSAAQVLGRIPGDGDRALAMALAAGDTRVREAALHGLLTERSRRRRLAAVIDTLRANGIESDSARASALIEAIGYVGEHDRRTRKALAELLVRAPHLSPAIVTARRRLAIGF
jgi:HEAT repeats